MPLPRPSENIEEWGNQIVDELENEIEKINQAANVNDNTSFAVTDSASTTLDGGINNSVTSIDLTSAANFPTSGTIVVGSEQITYTGKSTNQLTGCTRGANSTTAASHSDDDAVTINFTTTKSLNAGTASTDDVANVLSTLIKALRNKGVLA
tara:strand:+ start:125 stop:580 length:456 start_codon:yes stop_codon:yes gene_type:complete